MKKLVYNLPSIIFNVAEIVLIFLIGKVLVIPIELTICIIIIFSIVRMYLKNAKHYKDWYKCFIWSALVFTSLLVIVKADIFIAIIMTVFAAIVLSGKGDIKDCFMWPGKGKKTKYIDIEEFIKHNYDKNLKLTEFEQILQQKDSIAYQLYVYKFIDGKSFSEMEELVELDNRRITDKLNEVALSIRIFCNI